MMMLGTVVTICRLIFKVMLLFEAITCFHWFMVLVLLLLFVGDETQRIERRRIIRR